MSSISPEVTRQQASNDAQVQPVQPQQVFAGLLEMEEVGRDTFEAPSDNIGTPHIFGGQVLGQALSAAYRTLPAGKVVHSMHAYFLASGEHRPIQYEVERLRDGKSYAARRVKAMQGETTLFEAMISAQEPEEGLDYQVEVLHVAGPEGLQSEFEYRRATKHLWPSLLSELALVPRGIEYRKLRTQDILNPTPYEGTSYAWLRTLEPLPDTPAAHHAFLAYASDHGPLLAAIAPYDLSLVRGDVRLASLDHAIWFHRDFRLDDWILYEVDCTNIAGGRAISKGRFYQDGKLVASVVQEGLMRVRKPLTEVNRVRNDSLI
jgi:acyl-CoA thioesterase-2